MFGQNIGTELLTKNLCKQGQHETPYHCINCSADNMHTQQKFQELHKWQIVTLGSAHRSVAIDPLNVALKY